MNTPTLTLRAERIVSTEVADGYVLAAFKPGKICVKEFSKAQGTFAVIDLSDETGEWSNGRTMQIDDVVVSEDGRALSIRLLA